MRVRQGGRRRARQLLVCVSVWAVAGAGSARAFDFFGWFSEKPPQPTATTLPYELKIEGLDADKSAAAAINDVSVLYRLRNEPPQNGDELARRAESDLPRIVDAMWGAGYYAAKASIRVAGQPLTLQSPATSAARSAADRLKGRAAVPVEIVVEPGPLYRFSRIEVVESSGRGFDAAVLPERVISLKRDDPARTASLLEATAQLSDHFRDRGHPFVKVERRTPVIDHRKQTVDVALVVAPGPVAGLGRIDVVGTKDVDPAVVRSFIYAEPGDPYSPRALAAIRKSVTKIEAIGSARVREGTSLDANGNLPLTLDVTERLPRVIGGSVRYSTVDGPALKAYWAHRNLFGGAERLRIDADLFYNSVDQPWSTEKRNKNFDFKNLGGRLSASFLKPALGGTRNDLLIDVYGQRESTDFYTSKLVNATAAIRHRFTDSFSIQGGVEGEIGQSIDPLGKLNYGLIGLPVSVTYDSTDRPLDPTRGIKVTASLAPYHGFRDAPTFFGVGRAQASTYYALDEAARYIIAARVGFGSIVGGDLAEIPATRRFYAGGGGSVRGFEYKSLGPRDPRGYVIGGRSLIEGSLEARIKITDTIGFVPFIDAGQAYASSLPDGSERLRFAAGLGLRYYTSIGPIRVDVATPLDRRGGERPYAIYVSLGQSF
ncbi:autotransporter assembly complex family protein [Terrarubrum flagellatum]|uniref:autotransporter assembly complex protein TamA n=1 Tax=Terrirubrum flagellatum TaxID=2895980 RepID=UPI00314556DA